jgi:hypothetical protein
MKFSCNCPDCATAMPWQVIGKNARPKQPNDTQALIAGTLRPQSVRTIEEDNRFPSGSLPAPRGQMRKNGHHGRPPQERWRLLRRQPSHSSGHGSRIARQGIRAGYRANGLHIPRQAHTPKAPRQPARTGRRQRAAKLRIRRFSIARCHVSYGPYRQSENNCQLEAIAR